MHVKERLTRLSLCQAVCDMLDVEVSQSASFRHSQCEQHHTVSAVVGACIAPAGIRGLGQLCGVGNGGALEEESELPVSEDTSLGLLLYFQGFLTPTDNS